MSCCLNILRDIDQFLQHFGYADHLVMIAPQRLRQHLAELAASDNISTALGFDFITEQALEQFHCKVLMLHPFDFC